ncbi:AAA family ATPase [Paenibacillus oleatilyticus]|uniref:AAA family ATPase n=1 Tax=Paenibacillus oleatilyticus TaxID=2594886 RepID=UPI001C1FEEF4|nr:AAA family ATPase [Paenibacillus oleatilyticus]MBU7315513.1 AAA family ATPase [Paenibacillus oleatilyticus]
MRKLVFFLGPAGAGKTTLAKALARRRHAALFDMDTLSRPASEAIMTLSGLDPNDRDSDVYKIRCRDLGYRITMDAALENVDLGVNAFVIGPFTRELEDPVWPEKELQRIGASLHDVDVKAILVSLPGEQHYRGRIRDRGLALDAWKLENWSEFSRSLAVREVRWKLPASSILPFDNAGPLSEEKLQQVERFIYGDDSED